VGKSRKAELALPTGLVGSRTGEQSRQARDASPHPSSSSPPAPWGTCSRKIPSAVSSPPLSLWPWHLASVSLLSHDGTKFLLPKNYAGAFPHCRGEKLVPSTNTCTGRPHLLGCLLGCLLMAAVSGKHGQRLSLGLHLCPSLLYVVFPPPLLPCSSLAEGTQPMAVSAREVVVLPSSALMPLEEGVEIFLPRVLPLWKLVSACTPVLLGSSSHQLC